MISVIIPVYNVEAYINRCVESIVAQTYTNMEIILVDDGSSDNSGSICDDWAKKDSRIKVIHKINGGLSDARNAGIEIATGDYLGFVDGDDWIAENMYQSLLETIEGFNVSVATAGLKRVYKNGFSRSYYVFDKQHCITGSEIIKHYLHQDEFSTSACDKLFDARLFDNRRFPKGRLYEDTPVIFDILCNVDKIGVNGKPLYNYFQRAESICGTRFSKNKMDYFYFSKQVYLKIALEYSSYVADAKDFLGARICELIYLIQESPNSDDFRDELCQIRGELSKLSIRIIRNNSIPRIMKLKIVLAKLKLEKVYINMRKIIGKRT